MFKHVIIALVFLTAATASRGQHAFEQRIDSLVRAKMTEYRISGLSLSIINDGKKIYTKGYGTTSTDSGTAITPETRFVTGSVTKLFTATAVMQLAEQGKLDLDSALIKYIPAFRLKDKRYTQITLFQLLTHSSGLPWDNELKSATNDTDASRDFVLSLSGTRLKFSPGEKFSGETYSNTGFDILGYLVEKISGMSFPEYISRYILEKAGMSGSTFGVNFIPAQLRAKPMKLSGNSREIERFNLYGEIRDLNPVLKYPALPIVEWSDYQFEKPEHYPSGFLYASASDLGNWITACLGIHDQIKTDILSPNTLMKMWSLQRGIKDKKTSIGLGWWRFSDSTRGDYVFHVGNVPGYSSTLRIYPDIHSGVAILSNAMYADHVIWNELPDSIMSIVKEEKR